MPLQQKIVRSFQSDNDGYVIANLTVTESVRMVTYNAPSDAYSQETVKGEKECIQFKFDCPNGKTVEYLVFNVSISPDITGIKRIGTKNVNIYNKYTTVLLKLGFITEKELADMKKPGYQETDLDHILSELLAIKDKPVKFKPIRIKDKSIKREYDSVDWLSLELIETESAQNE